MAKRVASARHASKIPYIISQSHNGKLLNPQDIADEFSDFYAKLYNLKNDPTTVNPTMAEIDSFLSPLKLPSLSDSQQLALNSPITPQEISAAVDRLPIGKAPGPDGFSNEYYRSFSSSFSSAHFQPSYDQWIIAA